MNQTYNIYGQTEPSQIYLGNAAGEKLCALNGIQPDSVKLTLNLNNTNELTFQVDRLINIDDREVESNGYELLDELMRIYVEHIGWFIMQAPSQNNEGGSESKSIQAESVEIELLQHDLVGFKVNCGTTDSAEMLVEENVETDAYGVEFAKQQIRFYDPEQPELSLLDIALKAAGMVGWTIGEVDNMPKIYTSYEDGNPVEKHVLLQDEIGTFDIDSQGLYAFYTQDMAEYFECIFVFDAANFTINVYRAEHFGKDTSITIGFRNLENSNSISVNDNSIYTRYRVSGGKDLDIRYVNFGSDLIENIDYKLNSKYLPRELIEKYRLWQQDLESARPAYIALTRSYNEQLNVISELKDRVPLDDCSTDWYSFSLTDLEARKGDYEAQKRGIESLFLTNTGETDFDALYASDLASEYEQILNVILPNIEIAIYNKGINKEEDKEEYIEVTDYSLYGLDELAVLRSGFESEKEILESTGYGIPYQEESGHSQDYHEKCFTRYLEVLNQLDESYAGSCAEAYAERSAEVAAAEALCQQYDQQRSDTAHSVEKENWISNAPEGETLHFTEKDLALLTSIYNDTDYVNKNMFLVSSDDQISAIDEQQKLLNAAVTDLSSVSQPQYRYAASLDNFLALPEYRQAASTLKLGDFIWLGIRDDFQVKLRVISLAFHPALPENDIDLEFSNMIKSKASRNDLSALLNLSGSSGKNQISGTAGNAAANTGSYSIQYILDKILHSNAFRNHLDGSALNSFGGYIGKLLVLKDLEAEMIKATNIEADNGFFQYLQSQLISAGKIVADSGEFRDLSAFVATIDHLLAGTSTSELSHVIKLTAQNVQIDEAVIRDLIAGHITVSMLRSGTISTEDFNIIADDGGLKITGNTMHFYDRNGILRIQIGRDAKDDFTFCLYNEEGDGILIDDTGIRPSAISDGLIIGEMIADATISKNKLGFKVVETDENGKVSVTEILDPNGDSLGVSYTQMQSTITELEETMTSLESGTIKPCYISLKKESQTLPCHPDGTLKEDMLVRIPFAAYQGTSRITATAGTGVLPSGVTLAGLEPATETTDGFILLNIKSGSVLSDSSLNTGEITLSFTIGEQPFYRRFYWLKTNEDNNNIYNLETSTDILTLGENELNPTAVTLEAYVQDGKNGTKERFSGYFMIAESMNGNNFSFHYISKQAEEQVVYTPSSTQVKQIQCFLYQNAQMNSALSIRNIITLFDSITVPAQIATLTDTIQTVVSQLNKNTLELLQRVSQSDLINAINNYDGTEIKTIRDRITEVITNIDGISSTVSDITSVLTTADGTLMTSLAEKISNLEQTAEAIRTTVSETTAALQEVSETYSTLEQRADSIETTVSNKADQSQVTQLADSLTSVITTVDTNYSELSQTASEIALSVAGKQDSTLTSVRYIRDWLNGSSADSGNSNYFVECQVMAENQNVALGIRPNPLDPNGNLLENSSELSLYTDEIIDGESYIDLGTGGWCALELDLGTIHHNIDSICIWHYYADARRCSHRLEISADGQKWTTLYDSDIQGGYEESSQGKLYYLNDGVINDKISSITAGLDNVRILVQENCDNLAILNTDSESISATVQENAKLLDALNNTTEQNSATVRDVQAVQSQFTVSLDQIRSAVQLLKENGLLYESDLTQSSKEWKILFKQLGMYDGTDVPEQQTNIGMSIDGMIVSNPETGERTVITTKEFAGYYNDEKVFQLTKDLTITKRLQSENGIDFTTIKYLPIKYTINGTDYSCLAHIKSGGTS